jgi:hypothetical protein
MARRSDLNKSLNQFFTNQYVLYFLTIFALIHVIGYIARSQYDALIFFVVVGLLSTNFTKNLSIVFLSTIVITNLIYANPVVKYINSIEGFEGNSKKSKNHSMKDSNKHSNKHSKDHDNNDDDDKEALTERLDRREQLKNQYKRLEKMMDKETLQAMTKDSQDLMKSQDNLLKKMESMSPMIDNVKGMMDKMGGVDKVMDMANKLSSGANQLRGSPLRN